MSLRILILVTMLNTDLITKLCPLDRPYPCRVLPLERVAPHFCRILELPCGCLSNVCSIRNRCKYNCPLGLWCRSTAFHQSDVYGAGRRRRWKLDWRRGCCDGGHTFSLLQVWKANQDSKQIRTNTTRTPTETRRGDWSL